MKAAYNWAHRSNFAISFHATLQNTLGYHTVFQKYIRKDFLPLFDAEFSYL